MNKFIYVITIVLMLCSCSDECLNNSSNSIGKNETQELSEVAIKKMLSFYVKHILAQDKTRASNVNLTFGKLNRKYYSINSASTKGGLDEDSIAVYDLTINDGLHQGYAFVVGDGRIPCVLSYVPEGSLEDTLYNAGLKQWVNSIHMSVKSMYAEYVSSTSNKRMQTRGQDPVPIAKDSVALGNCWVNWWYEIFLNDAYFTCRLNDYYKADILTTQWDQVAPYNNNMHEISCLGNNKKVYTGCATTALTQILAHYETPNSYNWTLLKQTPRIYSNSNSAQVNEVARLMKDFQDLLKPSKFDCSGTTISMDNVKSVLSRYFNYKTTTRLSVSDLYKSDIPYLKAGSNSEGEGHLFVVDGFAISSFGYSGYPVQYRFWMSDDNAYMYWEPTPEEASVRCYFDATVDPDLRSTRESWHINWGWGGSSDGWYVISDSGLYFPDNNYTIYNISKK